MKFDYWFEWFALLLIIIIANVFIWLTTGSVVGKLDGCALVTSFSMLLFAFMKL